jgi:hypothetical protein
MATRVTPQTLTYGSAAALTLAAADAAGNTFKQTRNGLLVFVRNGGGSSITVTIAPVATAKPADSELPAITVPSITLAVAAAATAVLGPFPTSHVDTSGDVNVTYSGVTSVTVGAIQLPV